MGSTQSLYQNGLHIGGLAYVVLIMSVLYAIASWAKTHQLQLVFSAVQLVVCLMFVFQGFQIMAYGMILLTIISIAQIFLGIVVKNENAKNEASI